MNAVMTAVEQLRREAMRLQENQGRIARRNARRGVLGAMRRIRNAVNAEFPRLEKPTPDDDRCWFIEVFEKAHREGVGKKSRWIGDRWIIVREHFMHRAAPKRLFYKTGVGKPLLLRTASKYAKRFKSEKPEVTFRIRQASTDTVVMADVL